MQRRSANVFVAVRDLLASSMQGQLRPGDTLGVWTFNDDLYTGQLPLQRWSKETATASGRLVLGFINNHTNEKPARLENVVQAVNDLVKRSQHLSVILVTSGEQELSGTPFDEEVNQTFRTWRDRQQRAQQPMLTLLRAEDGQLTHFAVSPAPWPLEMPPLPEPPVTAATSQSEPPPAQPAATERATPPQPTVRSVAKVEKAPPSTVPPLIMIGSKSSRSQPELNALGERASIITLDPLPSGNPALASQVENSEGTNEARAPNTMMAQPAGEEALARPGEDSAGTAPTTSNTFPEIAANSVPIRNTSTPPDDAPEPAESLNPILPEPSESLEGDPATTRAAAQAVASRRRLILTASTVSVVGLGCFILLRRQRKPVPSFITQSIDRHSRPGAVHGKDIASLQGESESQISFVSQGVQQVAAKGQPGGSNGP